MNGKSFAPDFTLEVEIPAQTQRAVLPDPRYLKQRREGISYPALYVIDKAGRIAWARIDKDFRHRPSNSEIRAALDALQR